jgi:hypothetical protein
MLGQLRADIYKRDAVTCQYCGNRADTVDHLIPVSAGGLRQPHNLVAACERCNTIKANMHLPNLIQAFLLLIGAGRTSAQHYPILLWQTLLLGYPVEDIPWTQRRTRWSMRQLADLLFRNPDQPRETIAHADAYLLLSRVQACSLEDARELAERLVRHGYIMDAKGVYSASPKTPPPPDIREPPPRTPEQIHGGAFPLIGQPRRWFTARELKHEIRRELRRSSPAANVELHRLWYAFRKSKAVYDCKAYILIDQRVPLRLLIQEALERLGGT